MGMNPLRRRMTNDEQCIDGLTLLFLSLRARAMCSLLWDLVRLLDVICQYGRGVLVLLSELRQDSLQSIGILTPYIALSC